MNKIILKKVALGLFLAGYSISGAYAADTVSTKTDYILGHAPLVNSANIQPDFTANSIDIKVLNTNLQVYGNVFNSGKPATRPENEGGTNPTIEDSGTGGGETPTPPIDIIDPNVDSFAITIYEATISGGAVTMSGNSLSASSHPEVGKTYAAKVTLDENNVTKDITTQFAIQWSLVDFNGDAINAANSTSADVADLKATSATYQDATRNETVTNIAYTIPVNNQVMTSNNAAVTGLYAGAQGFKLKAEAIKR